MKIPVPSNRVVFYAPNGTLRWEASISGMPARQVVGRKAAPDGCDLPPYNGGRLYVPLVHGMAALDMNGKALWNVGIDDNVSLLATMPFGPDGTAYMVPDSKQGYWMSKAGVFYAIDPNGNVSVVKTDGLDLYLMAVSQGTEYYGQSWGQEDSTQDVGRLLGVNITALDLREGNIRGNLTIAPAEITTVVADRQNVIRLFAAQNRGYNSISYTEDHLELLDRTDLIYLVEKSSWVNVLAGGNVVYVGYYLLSYEYPEGYGNGYSYTSLHNSLYSPYGYPALLGLSCICYANGVAAVDADGNVIWNRPLDSMVTSMAAGNRTFYFGTLDGGLSSVRMDVAVGFTLTAALYLFFRFFLVGAVSRARSRINENENRNRVLKPIKAQPGNTMYEIARLLAMNAGTVRYHLLILGLNHRIATFRDGKYVRYFRNSGTYSEAEREIISLLRRDRTRSLLAALLERDGMSNVDLSRAIGITEPAVSGYMRELTRKGLVVREAGESGNLLYSIRADYREKVRAALGAMPGYVVV
jgi:predicted transcriptional regulator